MTSRPIAFAASLAAGFAVVASAALAQLRPSPDEYVAAGSIVSKHATQAAAADGEFVYAISSTRVAKIDRATGKELAVSTGQAHHLNSGFVWNGRLYCAHSNYPAKPHKSDLRVLDPKTMELTIDHVFPDPPGSLTWAVRRGEDWWCCFAHYDADNAKTVLVKYDAGWREQSRWTFPKDLVADWDSFSLSGGIWFGDDLLATGHHKKVIYRLRLPKKGDVVEVVDVSPAPFAGQGIAIDPKTAGIVGIDRDRLQVVFAKLRRNK